MAAEQTGQLADVTKLISAAQPATANVFHRLNSVMRDVRGVGKHGHNKHGGYSYAGHEAITDAVRDSYVKHGIVRTASVLEHQLIDGGCVLVKVRVSWVCTDNPSSRLDVDMVAVQPTQTKGATFTAQQMGQAVSYAVKNAELKCLSLTGDDTPDSDESDPNGPRDSERPSAPPAADSMATEAQELLSKFGTCKDAGEIQVVNLLFKSRWAEFKSVRGLAEQMTKARTKAYQRIKDGSSPENDGR